VVGTYARSLIGRGSESGGGGGYPIRCRQTICTLCSLSIRCNKSKTSSTTSTAAAPQPGSGVSTTECSLVYGYAHPDGARAAWGGGGKGAIAAISSGSAFKT
jgi:hypothetical protein